jgi:mRNA-degrading endonuclease RelE of RelBE toxin-antitoxin system
MAAAIIVRDSFLASAFELPKEISKKVFKALHLFVRDRRHPSLHVERLSGRASNMWSLRVDDDYRVVFQDAEGTPTLLIVAKHDVAYRAAEAAGAAPTANLWSSLRVPERLESAASSIRGPDTRLPVGLALVETLVRTKKYIPLARRLLEEEADLLELSFREIEELLGVPLPPAARKYRAWWANDTGRHVQASAWLGVGWKVSSVQLLMERVRFERVAGPIGRKAEKCL